MGEKNIESQEKNGIGVYLVIGLLFVVLLGVMSSFRGCGNSFPSIYYNGGRNQEFFIVEGDACWSLDALEQIGEISKFQHIPTKQFASNQGTVGQAIYRVYFGKEEWLMIDLVRPMKEEKGIVTYHSQIFFGVFE